jgi:hypothetical protein
MKASVNFDLNLFAKLVAEAILAELVRKYPWLGKTVCPQCGRREL